MMEAVLSNADHPEYGVATIPLPIPRNQYDHCVALLEHWRSAMPLKPTAAWTRSTVPGLC